MLYTITSLFVYNWVQAAEASKAEQERIRRALIDAEIETQRGANDVVALRQRLQVGDRDLVQWGRTAKFANSAAIRARCVRN